MVTQANPVEAQITEPLPAASTPELLPPAEPAPLLGAGGTPPAAAPSTELIQLQQQLAQQQQQIQWQQAQAAAATQAAAQQKAQADTQMVYAQATQQAQAAVRQMVEQGWDQDKAEIAAQAYYRGEAEKFLRQQDQQALVQQQKQQAVDWLSQRTGMPAQILQGYQTPEAMLAAAQQWMQSVGPQNQRLQQMERELQAMRRGQVPVQNYAQPPQAAGRVAANTENIDALYVQWEQQHAGQPGNPYEAQYRKFLGWS